jgi:hypothetical protein
VILGVEAGPASPGLVTFLVTRPFGDLTSRGISAVQDGAPGRDRTCDRRIGRVIDGVDYGF